MQNAEWREGLESLLYSFWVLILTPWLGEVKDSYSAALFADVGFGFGVLRKPIANQKRCIMGVLPLWYGLRDLWIRASPQERSQIGLLLRMVPPQ